MPFWGLVCTSLGFIIPAIVAYRRKRPRMGHSCSLLTVTSVLYHGTQKKVFKWMDIVYAHSVAICYSYLGVKKWILYRRPYDTVILGGIAGSIWIFYKQSCDKTNPFQDYWHMGLHGLSQLTWILHAIDGNINSLRRNIDGNYKYSKKIDGISVDGYLTSNMDE